MQRFIDKMANYVGAFIPGAAAVPHMENHNDETTSLAYACRSQLVDCINHGIDNSEAIKALAEQDCPLNEKYNRLIVVELLRNNNQSVEELNRISTALNIIIKFAQHLNKTSDRRRDQWRVIHFNNVHVKHKVRPLKGFEKVLQQLGYVSPVENGLSFPEGQEPDREKVTDLIADMMLLRKEMKDFLVGKHLHPQHIQQYIPQQTLDELMAFQLSGKKCEEDDPSDVSSSQVSMLEAEHPVSMMPVSTVNGPPPERNDKMIGNETSKPAATSSSSTAPIIQSASSPALTYVKITKVYGSPAPEEGSGNEANGSVQAEPEAHGEAEAIQDLPDVAIENSSGIQTSSSGAKFGTACDVCGDDAVVYCKNCGIKPLCDGCNKTWHKHPQRCGHIIEPISALANQSLDSFSNAQGDLTYGIMANPNPSPARISRKQQTQVQPVRKPQMDYNLGVAHPVSSTVPVQRGDEGLALNYYMLDQGRNHSEQVRSDSQLLDYQRQMSMNPHQQSQHHPQQLQYQYPHQMSVAPGQFPVSNTFAGNLSHSSGQIYASQDPRYLQSFSPQSMQIRSGLPSMHPSASQQRFVIDEGMNNYQHTNSQLLQQMQQTQQSQQMPLYVQQQLSNQQRRSAMEQPSIGWPAASSHPNAYNQLLPHQQHVGEMSPTLVHGQPLMAHHSMFQQPQQSMLRMPTDHMYQNLQPPFRHGGAYPPVGANVQQPIMQQHIYERELSSPTTNPRGAFNQNLSALQGTPIQTPMPLQTTLQMQQMGNRYHDETNFMAPSAFHQHRNTTSSISSSVILTTKAEELMNIPNPMERQELCIKQLNDVNTQLKDVENELNKIMLNDENEDFLLSALFVDLNKKKSALMKHKQCLESLMKQMGGNMMMMSQTAGEPANKLQEADDDLFEQEIFYPPHVVPARSAKGATVSNAVAMQTQRQDLSSTLQPSTNFNNNRSTGSPNALPGNGQTTAVSSAAYAASVISQGIAAATALAQGHKAIQSPASKTASPKVSPSPAIPPRPSQKKDTSGNLLDMTFPPPKTAAVITGKGWHCDHCTFINDASSHVCKICDRTSSNPRLASDSSSLSIPFSPADDGDKGLSDAEDLFTGDDKFIQLLNEIQLEEQREKQKNAITDIDEGRGHENTDSEETKLVGIRIVGSQEQVMIEKKKAQQEYLQLLQEPQDNSPQQEQKQTKITMSSNLPPTPPKSKSPSPSPSPAPFGVGARPKQPTNPKLGQTYKDQSCASSSEYGTPPSGTSPTPRSSPTPPSRTTPTSSPRNSPTPPSPVKPKSSALVTSIPSQQSSQGWMENGEDAESHDPLEKLNEISMMNRMCNQGEKLLKLIKMADVANYSIEAVLIAQSLCDTKMTPLEWLEANWKKNIKRVATMATTSGTQQTENCVGELSEEEAESAYISCQGNMKEAADLCVERRTKLYEHFSSLGEFPREEILQVMFQCKGNQDACESSLMEAKLQPLIENIWAGKDMQPASRLVLQSVSGSDICHSFSTSVIAHWDFQNAMKNKDLDRERRIRMIFVEGRLKSWGRAELVIKILDDYLPYENISLEDVVEAVRNCQDRNNALAYLQQECAICYSKFPMNKIRNLNICQCKMCEECLTTNFAIAIKEKHVRHWICPLCSLPDLNDTEIASDYLQFLSMLLQPLIEAELMNLFETKIRDWHLQKDDCFRWCAHCAEGFIAENRPEQKRMTCPHCGKKTCFSCKKQWEDQHEGLTCEEFAQWKIDNDPTNQSVGLAKHLDENGIDCPTCKMRFALAKGGCMHFKCPQCGHEFCSGCNEPYHHKDLCAKYQNCKNLGLHCHCPRDCFSYLRDYTVVQLQDLLANHNILFNVNIPEDQQDAAHCPVMEQKEFDTCKKDEKCGKKTVHGHAGLCELHYKEYLVGIINQHGLDPVTLMKTDEMINLLKKYDVQVPAPVPRQSDQGYEVALTKIIQDKLPLRRR